MSRTQSIISASLLLGLYLATAFMAMHWWMALDGEVSLWGTKVGSIASFRFNIEPLIFVLILALAPTLVCLFSRSLATHIWLLLFALYQFCIGVDYLMHGIYFGCDRNGCSAEENFVLSNIACIIPSMVGIGLVRVVASFVRAFRQGVPEVEADRLPPISRG